ncbi:MAG: DUF1934 domain-containing protein [Saccharofermentanales bacterium]
MTDKTDINRDAVIRMESRQWADGERYDPVRLTTHGRLAYEAFDDVWRVSYDEDDASGAGSTHTQVSLYPDGQVVLSRRGEEDMDIVFIKGDQRVEQKTTPFGLIHFSVLTHEVKGQLTEDGGAIEVGYSLGFDHRHTISTTLQIDVETSGDDAPEQKRRPTSYGKLLS